MQTGKSKEQEHKKESCKQINELTHTHTHTPNAGVPARVSHSQAHAEI